jgi:plastocyanin
MRGSAVGALAAAVVLWLSAAPAPAQSTLARTPNLEGAWAPRAGVVQVNFLHRFQLVGETRKVVSYPTFIVATGAPGNLVAGARYAPNSLLVPDRPNEWELFGRWVPARELRGHGLDLSVQLSHNIGAGGVDGELLIGRGLGVVRGLVGARGFSSFGGSGSAAAVVLGAVLRVTRHVALAADLAELMGRADEDVARAWSAGLQLEIPYTPHTLSLHASNVAATTVQGSVLGTDEVRWGFEFTVPITVGRYLGGAPPARASPAASEPLDPAGDPRVGATVDMDNGMSFLPDTVRIAAGEAVVWRNGGDIIHTVTGDPDRAERPGSVRLPAGARPFDSGDMRPGETFRHVFTVPGEYVYFCVPHELAGMVGVVIVE